MMKYTYNIVEWPVTAGEKMVSIVPSNWIIDDQQLRYWPVDGTLDMARLQKEPNATWDKSPYVRILKTSSSWTKIRQYEEDYLKFSEVETDLTDYDTGDGGQKRKRKATQKWSPSRDEEEPSSESEGSLSPSSPQSPSPPPQKQKKTNSTSLKNLHIPPPPPPPRNRSSFLPLSNMSQRSSFTRPDNTTTNRGRSLTSIGSTRSTGSSVPTSSTSNSTDQSQRPALPRPMPIRSTESTGSSSPTPSTFTSRDRPLTPGSSSLLDDDSIHTMFTSILTAVEENKQEMQQLAVSLSKITSRLASIENHLKVKAGLSVAPPKLPEGFQFPLRLKEELEQLNTLLATEKETKESFIQAIGNFGGGTPRQAVEEAGRRLLHPELTVLFNILGRKGKSSFNLMSEVKSSMMAGVRSKFGIDDKDFDRHLGHWLSGSGDRLPGARKEKFQLRRSEGVDNQGVVEVE